MNEESHKNEVRDFKKKYLNLLGRAESFIFVINARKAQKIYR